MISQLSVFFSILFLCFMHLRGQSTSEASNYTATTVLFTHNTSPPNVPENSGSNADAFFTGNYDFASEADAHRWINEYEVAATRVFERSVSSAWNYFTNVSDHNRMLLIENELYLGDFQSSADSIAKKFHYHSFQNESTRRSIERLVKSSHLSLPSEKSKVFAMTQAELSKIFENATVCANGFPPPCQLRLDPDISDIFSNSRDFGTLYYLWKAWRDAVGPQMRPMFVKFVELSNEEANMNGFTDTGEMWRSHYEKKDLELQIEAIFRRLLPLYQQLHSYVRQKLNRMYPGYLYRDGPLPAHLLEAELNYLYRNALDQIAFLPFAYVVDKWRWEVFNGNISAQSLNEGWWELRYFISYVLQFQFMKGLCDAAGHVGPLVKCSIDGSLEAGEKLRTMMSLGASKPWPEAMKIITGTDKIDAEPLLEYFQPLYDWLVNENQRTGSFIGWNGTGRPFSSHDTHVDGEEPVNLGTTTSPAIIRVVGSSASRSVSSSSGGCLLFFVILVFSGFSFV